MDIPTDLLDADQEKSLARTIEVGVLASDLRARRATLHPADCLGAAADADLAVLEREGERAWRRFADANVRLVWLVVMPVARRSGLDADELFQEGFLGLLEAMQRFDHTRAVRFATFALPWIRMRVANAAATNHGSLGLPPRRARTWRRVRLVEARLVATLGRLPDDAELARETGDTAGVVRGLRGFVPVAALPDDADMAVPDAEEEVWPDADLSALVRLMPGPEREVIERRFGFAGHPAMTLVEVAAELGVSQSTIRRRELSGLDWLRLRAGARAA